MKKVLFNFLWIINGIGAIVLGVICLSNPGLTMTTLGILLSLLLLCSGLFDIFAFFSVHREFLNNGWILLEGIFTLLFGFLLLTNNHLTSLSIPILFAIWMMFSGANRIVSSFDLKQYGFSSWWIVLMLGVLLILFASFSLMKPVLAMIAISMVLGIMFIIQGIEIFIKGYYMNKIFHKIANIFK